MIGGPGGARWGWAIGTLLAGYGKRGAVQSIGRLSDLRVSGSGYGSAIPLAYGMCLLGSNIIWAQPLKEHVAHSGGGKGKQPEVNTYTYTTSLAALVCAGPVEGIGRIWADDLLIYDPTKTPKTQYKIRTYLGTEDQLPDTLIAATEGIEKTPAYRGSCYIVLEDYPLDNHGNRVPNLRVEIGCSSGQDPLTPPAEPPWCVLWHFDATNTLTSIGSAEWILTPAVGTVVGGAPGRFGDSLEPMSPQWGGLAGGIPLSGGVNHLAGNALSVEFFFRQASIEEVGMMTVAYGTTQESPSQDIAWRVDVSLYDQTVRFSHGEDTWVNSPSFFSLETQRPRDQRQWHHVAITFLGAPNPSTEGRIRIYHNGGMISQASMVHPNLHEGLTQGGDYALIVQGNYNYGEDHLPLPAFDIDELLICNVEHTAAEIAKHATTEITLP